MKCETPNIDEVKHNRKRLSAPGGTRRNVRVLSNSYQTLNSIHYQNQLGDFFFHVTSGGMSRPLAIVSPRKCWSKLMLEVKSGKFSSSGCIQNSLTVRGQNDEISGCVL